MLFPGRGLHFLRKDGIAGRPCPLCGCCKIVAETFLQCPKQRVGDRNVVGINDAVSRVAAPEISDRGYQLVDPMDVGDDHCQHRDQLSSLFVHVSLEKRSQLWIQFE